ncbi:MAG: hypothetical protein EOP35_23880 [Rubrivivax sp.]|nr:MAG: hypothetical protein EOP35_23880 [Rubrivivax sp.]
MSAPAFLAAAPASAQEQVVTLRAPEGDTDLRNVYVREAVELALMKTTATDGPYRLRQSMPMNKRRGLVEAARRTEPNFMIATNPETGRAAGLVPVLFPIHLGVNRYRVCFVHEPRREAVRAAAENREAVARLRHVQGHDWADVRVMRANGFTVAEVGSYESMFEMIAFGRADLFCRSVLEVGAELRAHEGVEGLALDDSLLLAYDLPQYLYTHPANVDVISRIERGLHLAFGDGSLQALLRSHLQPSLALLNLQRRRLITLAAPQGRVEMNDRPFQLDVVRGPSR